MQPYHFIDRSVLQHRAGRIGASDLPALIPNPEHPNESLAGYGRTAVTLWQEKTGRKAREPAGLAAEMGHVLEPKATELFLREVFGPETAAEWFLRRLQYDVLAAKKGVTVRAEEYQVPPIYHSIELYTDDFIAHPDALFHPRHIANPLTPVTAHGLTIDLSRPFSLEAKSARYWAAKRPEDSMVSGYNLDLRTWQGIPLKHYVQIQFQLALLEIEISYLPLLYDTSEFRVWEIRQDRPVQNKLIDIAGKMAWHVKKDIPPKDLAMNAEDVKALYPQVKQDFVYVSGEEAASVQEASLTYHHASKQEKLWKDRKQEASDTLAVHLKDRKELRDETGVLARWIEREGAERVRALKKIAEGNPVAYRYLKRKGLIEQGEATRYPQAVRKEKEE